MKIKKGQKVKVVGSRSGNYEAIAVEDFDTENDEWYPLILDQERVDGLSTSWHKGERHDGRRGLCEIELRDNT